MSDVSLGALTAFTTWSPFGPRPGEPVTSAPRETRIPQNLLTFTNWMPFGVSNEFDCRARDLTRFLSGHQNLYLIRMLRAYTLDQNGSSSFMEGAPIQALFRGPKQFGSPSTVKLSAGSGAACTSSGAFGVRGHHTANLNSNSSSDSGNFSSLDSCSSSRSSISDNSEGHRSNARALNNVSSSTKQDPWVPKVVFPSSKFLSMSITPTFNIWSPSSEDDIVLDSLAYPSHGTDSISSDYSRQRKNSDTSNTASSISTSDQEEWGVFSSWSHVPTPDEAERLCAQDEAIKEVDKVCCKVVKKSVRHHWRQYVKTKLRSRRKVRSS